jgi:ribonucleoside-triphosphate reductase
MDIIKRDGRIVPFDKEKIVSAILKAFGAVGTIDEYAKTKAENIANYIAEKVEGRPEPYGVEEIQDLVEQGLMSLKHKDVAKAYILYREERNKVRQGKTSLMKLIGKKIDASDVQN